MRLLRRIKLSYRVFARDQTTDAIKWCAVASMVNSTASASSIHSMLSALKVSETTGAVVTHNYIGKDIIGQLGGLLYSFKKGKRSDKDPKTHVQHGLGIQYGCYMLESLIPYTTSLFLPMAGLANVGKNISWISLGAINAKVIVSLSEKGPLAPGELYSRISAINTLSSTVGLSLGLLSTVLIPSHFLRCVLIIPLCSSIHWYAVQRLLRHIEEK